MRRQLFVAVPLIAVLVSTAARAEMFGPEYPPCGNEDNTMATVDCVDAKTRVWDQRLNAAYKDLARNVSAGQRDPLKAAQRLWIQYRDANCRFYGSREGTIRQIQAAECLRAMTEERALELEQAEKL